MRSGKPTPIVVLRTTGIKDGSCGTLTSTSPSGTTLASFFANTNLVFSKIPNFLPPNVDLNLDDAWPGIFRRMFQPSPKLATMIDTWADQHQHLVPGSYSAAHVRAKFPVGETEIKMNKKRG